MLSFVKLDSDMFGYVQLRCVLAVGSGSVGFCYVLFCYVKFWQLSWVQVGDVTLGRLS